MTDDTDPRSAVANRRLSWTILATIAGFTIVTVYCTYLSVYAIDAETGVVAGVESLKQYRQALAGTSEFPFQWRLLGTYLVNAGERLTGVDPHAVDAVIKTLLLFASSTTLFMFSRLSASDVGSLCVVAFYHLATVVGFSDYFRIYFTNDYAMLACWFAAVYLIATQRCLAAALMTFVGAWSKETMLLVPLLVALRRLHGGASNLSVVANIVAFLVPTVILRTHYPAPIAKWAWWETIFLNIPILHPNWPVFVLAVKSNLKVVLLYNALWIVGLRSLSKADKGSFARDLRLAGVLYVVLIYPVVFIRELRHFLPLAIVVLPSAIAELERRTAHGSTRAPAVQQAR